MIDPLDIESLHTRQIQLKDGRRYLIVDQVPETDSGLAPLFCFHGFPDCYYGYRYLIQAAMKHGIRCIVPSMPGYIGTDPPEDLIGYSMRAVSNDMSAILDQLGLKRVHCVGHDWGGALAWRFAEYHPSRVVSLSVLCTPYMSPARPGTPYLPLEQLVASRVPSFGYQIYFASDQGRKMISEKPHTILWTLRTDYMRQNSNDRMKGHKEGSAWASQQGMTQAIEGAYTSDAPLPSPKDDPEFNNYLKCFPTATMLTALNWYRVSRINYDEDKKHNPGQFPAQVKALFVRAGQDAALPVSMSAEMLRSFPAGNCTIVDLPQANHWILQDHNLRDGAIATIFDWAKRHDKLQANL